MKLAFIGHLGEVSGAGMALLRWAALCQKNGWECCVALPEGPIHERAAKLGVRAAVYPLPRGNFSLSSVISYLNRRHRARSFLQEWLALEQPDWVVVHSSANVVAAAAIRASGIKCLWHIHEESQSGAGLRQRLKRREILRTAHRLAFASSTGLLNFNAGAIPSQNLRNPLENLDELLALERHPAQPPLILFNGTNHRKGLDRFISALYLLQNQYPDLAWQSIILGELHDTAPCQTTIKKKASLMKQVRFAGVASSEQMLKYYEQATLVVSASRTESLPIFLVEALVAGIPVVATDTGDCPALLGHGAFGSVINAQSEDDQELAHAIGKTLQAGSSSKAIGWRQKIADDYDPGKIFESLKDLLKE